nr:immunoglobulin heavy chain junction region [Macaca mulatta]
CARWHHGSFDSW